MNKKIPYLLAALSVIFLFSFCHRRSEAIFIPGYGYVHNDDMKIILRKLNANSTYPKNVIQSDQGIAHFEELLTKPNKFDDSLGILTALAKLNLMSGHSYKCIGYWAELKKLMAAHHMTQMGPNFSLADIDREIALARFRNSEQLNCQLQHGPNSCIYPFAPDAVHIISDDAKESRQILLRLLYNDPHDLQSRWLLNIVNSALGYPTDSIPGTFRIDMRQFEADSSFKPFKNVAIQAGVVASGLAGGAATEDFNNDGLIDIVVSSCGLDDPLRLFINKGDGTFEERTKQAGLDSITGGLNLITCDYNNDGFMDIYVMRGGWMVGYGNFPNSLLRNNGDGTFTDVTMQAGLFSLHPTQTAVWADFNHDGWLDVFVGHETTDPSDPHPSEFYINNKDGTFTECSQKAGLHISQFIKATVSTDINNDGWPDIYVSCFGGKNILFKNMGMDSNHIPHFTDVAEQAGVTMPINSFSVLSVDLNNDGWEDLYVSAYELMDNMDDFVKGYVGLRSLSHPYIYINQKNGTYKEQSDAYHLHRSIQAMGINFGDIDNDGYPDIYCGTGNPDFKALYPNVLLHNVAGKYFEDITIQTRTGNLQKGHGVAFCDIDNDGDEDIYEDMGGFFKSDIGNNVLFENPGNGNNYIGFLLQGSVSDRSAVGARIDVSITENNNQRHIYKTVGSGGSFGANSFRQLIGVGKAAIVNEVNIYFPTSGIRKIFKNIAINKYYQVNEGKAGLTELKLPHFRL